MADEELKRELATVLAKYGVAGLPQSATKGPQIAVPGGAAASYIREIITDGQVFDEEVLNRVVNVLKPR